MTRSVQVIRTALRGVRNDAESLNYRPPPFFIFAS